MKKLFLLVLASCGMLMSCGDDDSSAAVDVYAQPEYLVGEIGGKQISIVNTPEKPMLGMAMWGVDEHNLPIVSWHAILDEDTESLQMLGIFLRAPHEGSYEMTKSAEEATFYGTLDSGIDVQTINSDGSTLSFYQPDHARGNCYVEITNMWNNRGTVQGYIKGTIRGVLYNTFNRKDSLIIKRLDFCLH